LQQQQKQQQKTRKTAIQSSDDKNGADRIQDLHDSGARALVR